MGFVQVLQSPLTFHKHAGMWIGCNKFPLGVNVCVWTSKLLIIRMLFFFFMSPSYLPPSFAPSFFLVLSLPLSLLSSLPSSLLLLWCAPSCFLCLKCHSTHGQRTYSTEWKKYFLLLIHEHVSYTLHFRSAHQLTTTTFRRSVRAGKTHTHKKKNTNNRELMPRASCVLKHYK